MAEFTPKSKRSRRLIAAAPEMYELLQALVNHDYDNTATAIMTLEAAKLLKRIDGEEASNE